MLNIFNMASFVNPNTNIKIPGITPVQPVVLPSHGHPFSPFRKILGIIPISPKGWPSLAKAPDGFKIPIPGEGLPRVIHYCADQSGCGFWRMIWPADDLLAYNKAVVMTLYQMVTLAQFYGGIDAVRLQRQCTENQLEFVKFLRTVSDEFKRQTGKGFRIIWEVDDVVLPHYDIPDYNACKAGFVDDKIHTTVKEIVKYVDEMTVVSEYMKQHYKKHLNFDKISVVPNYAPKHLVDVGFNLEKNMFNYKKSKGKHKKPRILYAGSATHFDVTNNNYQRDDFQHITDYILDDIINKKKYEWVFLGGALPYRLREFIGKGVEFHPWIPLPEYPDFIRNLNCQIMLAPLADNVFNRAKSNIKLTEGGAFGIPVIAQNIDCYNVDGWKYLFNTGAEMMQMVEDVLKTPRAYQEAIEFGRKYAAKYELKNHLDELVNIYTTPYGDEKRKESKWFYEMNKDQFK